MGRTVPVREPYRTATILPPSQPGEGSRPRLPVRLQKPRAAPSPHSGSAHPPPRGRPSRSSSRPTWRGRGVAERSSLGAGAAPPAPSAGRHERGRRAGAGRSLTFAVPFGPRLCAGGCRSGEGCGKRASGAAPHRGCPSAPLAVGGMRRCRSPSAFTGLLEGASWVPASLCESEPGYTDA